MNTVRIDGSYRPRGKMYPLSAYGKGTEVAALSRRSLLPSDLSGSLHPPLAGTPWDRGTPRTAHRLPGSLSLEAPKLARLTAFGRPLRRLTALTNQSFSTSEDAKWELGWTPLLGRGAAWVVEEARGR